MVRIIDLYKARYKVEAAEGWRELIESIPPICFPTGWHVRIIPPFGGAMARFRVSLDGNRDKEASVYLDCFDRLGYMKCPYWEVYPYKGDCGRCLMADTVELIDMIAVSLSEIAAGKEF